MVAYADEYMPIKGGNIQLILFGGQDALMQAAEQLGYYQKKEKWDMQYDFINKLNYSLPEGFSFVKTEEYVMAKGNKCCWKGFGHEEKEGSWNYQHEQTDYLLKVAPHATADLAITIKRNCYSQCCSK